MKHRSTDKSVEEILNRHVPRQAHGIEVSKKTQEYFELKQQLVKLEAEVRHLAIAEYPFKEGQKVLVDGQIKSQIVGFECFLENWRGPEVVVRPIVAPLKKNGTPAKSNRYPLKRKSTLTLFE
jgi:hypothetical protein